MIFGLLLSALGGGLDASQALVMGLAKRWRWESIWLVWAVFGCFILPWAAAYVMLRDRSPIEVFGYVSRDTLAQVILFGLGWGIGSILFGLGIVRVGMGLGLGIAMSLTAANGAFAVGSRAPPTLVVAGSRNHLSVRRVVSLGHLSLLARRAPDRAEEKPLLERETASFAVGIICCIASGFTSPMFNLAINAGIEIDHAAAEHLNAGPIGAGMVPVAIIMSSGFIINAGYCTYLLLRHRSWEDFTRVDAISHWFYGALMGLLQMAAFLIYAIAASRVDRSTRLGGAVLAWPVYTASMIIIGNLEGLLRGEWKGSDRRTFILLAAGLALLVVASTVVVGFGSYLAQTTS